MRVAEQQGITAVTMDAVAEEAGVTKRGLLYHWPNREALLLAVADQIADGMEELFQHAAGAQAEDATPEERADVYLRVAMSHPATAAELAFLLELPKLLDMPMPWDAVLDRWAPAPDPRTDNAALDLWVARLAADGLWATEALFRRGLAPFHREAVAARILALAHRHPDIP